MRLSGVTLLLLGSLSLHTMQSMEKAATNKKYKKRKLEIISQNGSSIAERQLELAQEQLELEKKKFELEQKRYKKAKKHHKQIKKLIRLQTVQMDNLDAQLTYLLQKESNQIESLTNSIPGLDELENEDHLIEPQQNLAGKDLNLLYNLQPSSNEVDGPILQIMCQNNSQAY